MSIFILLFNIKIFLVFHCKLVKLNHLSKFLKMVVTLQLLKDKSQSGSGY